MRPAMKNVARSFAAASFAVGGIAIVGCHDDMDRSTAAAGTRAGDAELARPASSSSGAVDAYGRTHSQSPSTAGAQRGGVGTVPAATPGAPDRATATDGATPAGGRLRAGGTGSVD